MKIPDFDCKSRPGFRYTIGETLRDGTVFEAVLSQSGDKLDLLHFDRKTATVAAHFKVDGVIYHAPYMPLSLLRAVTLPRGAAEYGTRLELFRKIAGHFQHYAGILPQEAAFLAYLVKCSWAPAPDPGPITAYITGADAALRQRLRQLLHVFCRRAFVTAELSRRLPLFFSPTLVLTDPMLSARAVAFWRASNSPGAYVPESRGEVRTISCPKLIFGETLESRDAWGPEALHLHLPPVPAALPPFTEREEEALTAEYQPQLLLLRLHVLVSKEPPNSASDRDSSQLTNPALRRHMPLFLQREPEIVAAVTPLLEAHEEELTFRRQLNPEIVLVEVLWHAAHADKEISTAAATQRLNDLLRLRGETLEYNAKEIGWTLARLGLPRRDNGHNRVLRFSREIRRRVHLLAAQFELKLRKKADCGDCADPVRN